MKINVSIVQMEAILGDIEANFNKVENLLVNAHIKNTDLILLPELWTTGWDCANFNKNSEELHSSRTLKFLKNIALKYNANVIGGSAILHKNNEKDRNTSLILNREGNLLASYDKYHLFSHRGEAEGSFLEAGEAGLIVNTDIGRIGISTCYDIRFPELFRLYAFKGADFIVNMSAWPEKYVNEYIILVKARAVENQTFLLSACLTGAINENFSFSGHSFIADYMGNTVKSLNKEEKVLTSSINTEEMKEYRMKMPILKDTKKNYKLVEI